MKAAAQDSVTNNGAAFDTRDLLDDKEGKA